MQIFLITVAANQKQFMSIQTGKTTSFIRIAVRETDVFLYHGAQLKTLLKPLKHHRTMVSRSLRWPLIGSTLYRETPASQTAEVNISSLGLCLIKKDGVLRRL